MLTRPLTLANALMTRKIRILCYGDSNTYGFDPFTGRYPVAKRWTSQLGLLLGDAFLVLNEGQNGRTTAFDSYGGHADNGLASLGECLERNAPADILIFMLGTNDCATLLDLPAKEIAKGMEQLLLKVEEDRKNGSIGDPQVIIVAPPGIRDGFERSPFAFQLDAGSVAKSRAIVPLYRQLAEKHSCLFLDGSGLDVSEYDCEHLTEDGHRALAEMLAGLIGSQLFGK